MVELLDYLEDNGFSNYIASGGGRDFMRPLTSQVYRIPPARVIGSSMGLEYFEDDGAGHVRIGAVLDVIDDGPEKPLRIWDRIGRRPILAAGNSDGDIAMLRSGDDHRGDGIARGIAAEADLAVAAAE